MLKSMTGFGEAHRRHEGVAISVELRSINSRYFKFTLRSSEGYHGVEPLAEAAVRERVKRGAVQMNLRVDRPAAPDDYRINEALLRAYYRQLESIYDRLHINESVEVDQLLLLPGVVEQRSNDDARAAGDWPVIEEALGEALEKLSGMREREGQAMAADFLTNAKSLAVELDAIEQRAPAVSVAYRQRLLEKINTHLEELETTIDAADVVREVALFADKSDISEEVVRMRSHLDQFELALAKSESTGRKLEFLIQEMFRETNTIGSKANDVEIARHVVNMKTAIERMREMVQNVE